MRFHIKFRPRSSTWEQIENSKFKYFSKKIVYEQKYRLQRKYFSGVKKCRIRLMRSAIIKKARQDEQQN